MLQRGVALGEFPLGDGALGRRSQSTAAGEYHCRFSSQESELHDEGVVEPVLCDVSAGMICMKTVQLLNIPENSFIRILTPPLYLFSPCFTEYNFSPYCKLPHLLMSTTDQA